MDTSFVLLPLLYLCTGTNGIPQSDLSLPVSGSINILAPQNTNIDQGLPATSTDILMAPPQTEHILDLMHTFPSNHAPTAINSLTASVNIIGNDFAIPNSELPLNIQKTQPAPQINVLSSPRPAPTQNYQQQTTGHVAVGPSQQIDLMDIPFVSAPTDISNTDNYLMGTTNVVLTQPEFNPGPFQSMPQQSFEALNIGFLNANDPSILTPQSTNSIGSDYINNQPRLMANMDYHPTLPQSFQTTNLEPQPLGQNPTVTIGSLQDPSLVASLGLPSDISAIPSMNSGFQQSQLPPQASRMQELNPMLQETLFTNTEPHIVLNTGLPYTHIQPQQQPMGFQALNTGPPESIFTDTQPQMIFELVSNGAQNQPSTINLGYQPTGLQEPMLIDKQTGFQQVSIGAESQPTAQNLGLQPMETGHQYPVLVNTEQQISFQANTVTHTQPPAHSQGNQILNEPQSPTVTITQPQMILQSVNTDTQTHPTTQTVGQKSLKNRILAVINTQPQMVSNLEMPSTDLQAFQVTNNGAQIQPSVQTTRRLLPESTVMNTQPQTVSNIGMPLQDSQPSLSTNTVLQLPPVQAQLNILQAVNWGSQDTTATSTQPQINPGTGLQSLSLTETSNAQSQISTTSLNVQPFFGLQAPNEGQPATEQTLINTKSQLMGSEGIPPSQILSHQQPTTHVIGQNSANQQSTIDLGMSAIDTLTLPYITTGLSQSQYPFSDQNPLTAGNFQSPQATQQDASNQNLFQSNIIQSVPSKPILTSNPAQISQYQVNLTQNSSLGPLSIAQGSALVSDSTQQSSRAQTTLNPPLEITTASSKDQQPVITQAPGTQTLDITNKQRASTTFSTEQLLVTGSNPAQPLSQPAQRNQPPLSQPDQITNPQLVDPYLPQGNTGIFNLDPNAQVTSSQLQSTLISQSIMPNPSRLTHQALDQSRSLTQPSQNQNQDLPSLTSQYQGLLATKNVLEQPAQQLPTSQSESNANQLPSHINQLVSIPNQVQPTSTQSISPFSEFRSIITQPRSFPSHLQSKRIVQGSIPSLFQTTGTQTDSMSNLLKPTSSQTLNPSVSQTRRFPISQMTQTENLGTPNIELLSQRSSPSATAQWQLQILRSIQGSSPPHETETSISGLPMPDAANIQTIKAALERFPVSQALQFEKLPANYQQITQTGTNVETQKSNRNPQPLGPNLESVTHNMKHRHPIQNTRRLPLNLNIMNHKSSRQAGEMHAEWATYPTNNPVSFDRSIPVSPPIQPARMTVEFPQAQPKISSSNWSQTISNIEPGPRANQFQRIITQPGLLPSQLQSTRLIQASTPNLFQPTSYQSGSTLHQLKYINSQYMNPTISQTHRIPSSQATIHNNPGTRRTELLPQPSLDARWQLPIIRNIQGSSPPYQSHISMQGFPMPYTDNIQTLKAAARRFPLPQASQFSKFPINNQQFFNRKITPRSYWATKRGTQRYQPQAPNSQWVNQWNTPQVNLQSISQNIRPLQQIQNAPRTPLDSNRMNHMSSWPSGELHAEWATYSTNNPSSQNRNIPVMPVIQPASRVVQVPQFQSASHLVSQIQRGSQLPRETQFSSIASFAQPAQVGELVSQPIGSKNLLKDLEVRQLRQGATKYNSAASIGNDMLMNMMMLSKVHGGANLPKIPQKRQMEPLFRNTPIPKSLIDSLGYYDPITKEFIPFSASYGPEFVRPQPQFQPNPSNIFQDAIGKSRLTAWNHIKKLPRQGLIMDYVNWRLKMRISTTMPSMPQFVLFLKSKINVLAPMFVTMQPTIYPEINPIF